jgi:hypothetical protein
MIILRDGPLACRLELHLVWSCSSFGVVLGVSRELAVLGLRWARLVEIETLGEPMAARTALQSDEIRLTSREPRPGLNQETR